MSQGIKRVTVYDIGRSYVEVTGDYPTVLAFVGRENWDRVRPIGDSDSRVMSRVETHYLSVQHIRWMEMGVEHEEFFVMTPDLRDKLEAPFKVREEELHEKFRAYEASQGRLLSMHEKRLSTQSRMIDGFCYAPIWKRLWMAIKGEM